MGLSSNATDHLVFGWPPTMENHLGTRTQPLWIHEMQTQLAGFLPRPGDPKTRKFHFPRHGHLTLFSLPRNHSMRGVTVLNYKADC